MSDATTGPIHGSMDGPANGAPAGGTAGAPITPIFPHPSGAATDAELLSWYAGPPEGGPDRGAPRVSFNFVSSLDGAATVDGRSGGLGSAADQRIFKLLRRHADVLLLGAQTVRAEGYAGELLDDEAQRWRVRHGKPAHPSVAIVSGSLRLDPESRFFTAAPVRPLIFTTGAAPASRRRSLEAVADVVTAGAQVLDVDAIIDELTARGLPGIHSEGGPHLFGSFQEAGRVDELCLSLSPLLVGGQGPRISASIAGVNGTAAAAPEKMRLAHVLTGGDMLFLRYLRG
ncbi:pyrimidine reductase family protein [Paenarthrobacter sp. PH39-S1]|uniref:pyrimidine reductase family protein n=1 Tax=Paenarthrobacter sp. PH39-S1 TaxID=3046204 RepID=UPI0024B9FF80|nr:pyrimidine reductase family protein [Paenarthrobacter sp. PH39-S1]MDJ0356474.1 pyrimidine reductase family protein [Paenarthrobacter sp. PH39-S1]